MIMLAALMQIRLDAFIAPHAAAPSESLHQGAWFLRFSRRNVFAAANDSNSSIPNKSTNSRGLWQTSNSSNVFNASQFANADEVLLAHQHWQADRLQEALQAAAAGKPFVAPKAVLYKQFPAGWGNRLPAVVTGESLRLMHV